MRAGGGPVLLRLRVPRLSGHSGQDTQAYKTAADIGPSASGIHCWLASPAGAVESDEAWQALEADPQAEVQGALARIEARAPIDAATRDALRVHGTAHRRRLELQAAGRPACGAGAIPPEGSGPDGPPGARINMLTAIRRTLEHELAINPRVLIFGEDVGRKGGVHAATLGLQERFGEDRVFDTSLSEEGIIGRAVGMALAGLVPVPEIQFRKYAEPAAEQLHDCGTIRWRTPTICRADGGAHAGRLPQVRRSLAQPVQRGPVPARGGLAARIPVECGRRGRALRTALRGNDPVIFFEHRCLLDGASGRGPVRATNSCCRSAASRLREGAELTVVSWGAMVERCEQAAAESAVDVELLDLRTLAPWDREAVLASVAKTRRCLIVHEDTITAGFGAEIAAVLAAHAFFDLDAPGGAPRHAECAQSALARAARCGRAVVGDIVAAMRRVASI